MVTVTRRGRRRGGAASRGSAAAAAAAASPQQQQQQQQQQRRRLQHQNGICGRSSSAAVASITAILRALCYNHHDFATAAAHTPSPPPPPPAAQYVPLNHHETLVIIEAENMTAASAESRWRARPWAHSPNYFASTVANVFHSRRAHLHHPAAAGATAYGEVVANHTVDEVSVAAASFEVPANGRHSIMIRYEAPYRFEVPFAVKLVQSGKTVSRHVFGRRSNPKVWGFQQARMRGEYAGCGPGLNTECAWPWGATENMVWEVQPTLSSLKSGPAQISVAPVRDSDYCCWGDINIDAIVINPNSTEIARQMNDSTVRDLPFDGMFSQLGEVFFRITNFNHTHNLSVGVPLTYNHAIERGYRTHLNGTSFRTPVWLTVAPSQRTGWLDVGGWMDTLQHGSWTPSCVARGARPTAYNATQCKQRIGNLCPTHNRTACDACAAAIAARPLSECPDGCTHAGKCYDLQHACVSPPPPPSVQELACYAVVRKLCAQNQSNGHAYASNYTKCKQCMTQQHPCPKACSKGTRCEGAWFEHGCHAMQPPQRPQKPKPLPPAPILDQMHCQIEVGVRKNPFDRHDREVVAMPGVKPFDSLTTGLEMLFDVNARATRRMRRNADDFFEVMAQLGAQGEVPGRPPKRVPVYSTTFPNGSDTTQSGTGPARDGYAAAQRQFVGAFCATENSCLCTGVSGCGTAHSTNLLLEQYVLAARTPELVEKDIAQISNISQLLRQRISTVKLADEIRLSGNLNDSTFRLWSAKNGISLQDLGCDNWSACPFLGSFANASATNAKLYYWSQKADHDASISRVKQIVARLQPMLPNALLGANWAPGEEH
jgi:hypothetical protein